MSIIECVLLDAERMFPPSEINASADEFNPIREIVRLLIFVIRRIVLSRQRYSQDTLTQKQSIDYSVIHAGNAPPVLRL